MHILSTMAGNRLKMHLYRNKLLARSPLSNALLSDPLLVVLAGVAVGVGVAVAVGEDDAASLDLIPDDARLLAAYRAAENAWLGSTSATSVTAGARMRSLTRRTKPPAILLEP